VAQKNQDMFGITQEDDNTTPMQKMKTTILKPKLFNLNLSMVVEGTYECWRRMR